MTKGIKTNNIDDLPPELRKELEGVGKGAVPDRLVALGGILQSLKGMARRDALWVLRKAVELLK